MGSSRTRSDRSSDVLAKLGAGSERHGHELFERLTQGIRALADSEQWRRHLDLQSRFHHYSANNVVLIGLQRPDATRVAGFSAWRRLGRSVRKGEKALWIMAPIIRRKVGSDSTSSEDERVVGFKYVPVFDIAQTQGPPLPDVCSNLPGDDPSGVFDSLKGCAVSLGFHVIDHDFGGSANGDCNHLGHEIRVEVANGPVQRIKTLAHELAHAVLHKTFNSRVMAELEAESTAYIVCQSFGIDSGAYSFGYVTSWAGGGEEATRAVGRSCDRIQKAAAVILDLCAGSGASPTHRSSA